MAQDHATCCKRAMPSAFYCLPCSVYKNKPVASNQIPCNLPKNQGRDHLIGKSHGRIVNQLGTDLFTENNLRWFFADALQQESPVFTTKTTPVEAWKDYLRTIRADVEFVMSCHAPPPPPPPDVPHRHKTTKVVARQISSPSFARLAPHGWARLLCCWDDASQSSHCQRPDCKYTHVSTILDEWGLPMDDMSNWISCFRHHPCTFAGMDGGCRYHPYNFSDWDIPEHSLTPVEESTSGVLPIHLEKPSRAEEIILCPTHTGWAPQNRIFTRCLLLAVHEYLYGYGWNGQDAQNDAEIA